MKGINMQALTIYKTTDGKTFEVEAEAAAHQSGLDNAAVIDTFLDKHYPKAPEGSKAGPGRSIAGKAIALWLSEQVAA